MHAYIQYMHTFLGILYIRKITDTPHKYIHTYIQTRLLISCDQNKVLTIERPMPDEDGSSPERIKEYRAEVKATKIQ